MTRFNITLQQGVDFVLYCLQNSLGKEIFVPKLYSYNITDIANAIDKKAKKKIIGVRPGEKLHEELITFSDSFNTLETKNFYIILPKLKSFKKFIKKFKSKKIIKPFSYNSRDNKKKLNVSKIRSLFKIY